MSYPMTDEIYPEAASPGYTGNPICDPSPSVDFVVGGIGVITALSALMNVSGFCLGKGWNPFCSTVARGGSFALNSIFLLGIMSTLAYRHFGGCPNL